MEQAVERGEIEECVGLFPFLSDKSLHKLADYMMKNGSSSALKEIMPFL